MTLKQLRYFLAVLRAGSLTAAARSLHVAQPAIGQQIRSLEDELGVRLLMRHSRGVMPTGAGDLLAQDAARLVGEAERMRQKVMEMGDAPRGRIALGLTASAAQMLGAGLVRVCQDKYPDLDLAVMDAMSHRLADRLNQGELDIAMTCAPPQNAVSEALATEPLYFVAPRGHALDEGLEITLRAALEADLVLPPKPSMIHELLADAARASNAALRVVCTMESTAAIRELVRCGLGCTVMPFGAAHREIEDGWLTAMRIVDLPLARTLYLTCAQDRPGSRAAEAVCEEIRTLVAELVASGIAGWAPCAKPPSD